MVGTLAQQIALISYGNEFIQSGNSPQQFYLANSTFQFCNNVNFLSLKKRILSPTYKEVIMAQNPSDWFTYLKKEKCKKMRLHYQHSRDHHQDHKLAAFINGGGTWLIETVYEGYSDYWANRWEVTNSDAPDKRIWSVNYANVLCKQKTTDYCCDLVEIKNNLAHTLKDICEFARKQDLLHWASTFEKAYKALHSSSPSEEYYHKDLIVIDNYDLIAKQVLFSAGIAWVFGGMGSWNDLGFNDQEDNNLYESLSKRLYENICSSIMFSINSF